jgi:hypothetical protein
MTRALVAVTAIVAGLLAAATTVSASAAASGRTVLHAGVVLRPGQALHSPNGAYTASLGPRGHLVLRHGRHVVWATRPSARNARLRLQRSGNLVITAGRRTIWSTRTRHATALALRDTGVLVLRSAAGTVWTNRIRNRCSARNPDKRVLIDISTQFARLCRGDVQVLTTPVTSGASAYGDGTPTGTWRVQAKQRERYLYPAAGGAYYVHYWIPYDGAYGMHDSSWQHFPYGSQQYRTRGSHGCVHFPLAAIRWMYGWLRVGTLVRIQS